MATDDGEEKPFALSLGHLSKETRNNHAGKGVLPGNGRGSPRARSQCSLFVELKRTYLINTSEKIETPLCSARTRSPAVN